MVFRLSQAGLAAVARGQQHGEGAGNVQLALKVGGRLATHTLLPRQAALPHQVQHKQEASGRGQPLTSARPPTPCCAEGPSCW